MSDLEGVCRAVLCVERPELKENLVGVVGE